MVAETATGVLPHGSFAGGVGPSTAKLTLWVTPRMVRSPSTASSPSLTMLMPLDLKCRVGNFSTSKKSGLFRCASRCSSRVWIEAASIEASTRERHHRQRLLIEAKVANVWCRYDALAADLRWLWPSSRSMLFALGLARWSSGLNWPELSLGKQRRVNLKTSLHSRWTAARCASNSRWGPAMTLAMRSANTSACET